MQRLLERVSVSICRRAFGVEASICAHAWTQRGRWPWRIYVAVIDRALRFHEPEHCRRSAARCGLIDREQETP